MDDMKTCIVCGGTFPRTKEFFYANKGQKDGLLPRCKGCHGKDRKPRPKVPEDHKRCPRCERVLPFTDFHVSNTRHDGRNSHCIPCANAINTERYALAKERGPKEVPPATMACNKCGREKPATPEYFPAQANCQYGLRKSCKECEAPYRNKWGKSDKRRIWERKHYKAHRVRYFHNRYETQKDMILRKQRLFNLNNPEIVRGWKRKYAKSDRGLEAGRLKTHRRRARRLSVPGSHTAAQIQEQLKRQRYKCYYCQHKLEKHGKRYIFHVDHTFPLAREHASNEISHLVLTCPTCNLKKGDKYPWEFPEGGRLL